MRNIILTICLAILTSCSVYKIDMQEAKACADGYLQALQESNLTKASSYYSNMFNETESPERRIEKMKQLEEVMGKIVSYNLTDSLEQRNGADVPTVLFTYKVKHTAVNATYKFTIMKDEGEYKIVSQYVETTK